MIRLFTIGLSCVVGQLRAVCVCFVYIEPNSECCSYHYDHTGESRGDSTEILFESLYVRILVLVCVGVKFGINTRLH